MSFNAICSMGVISNFILTNVTWSNLFSGDFEWDYFPTFKFSLNSISYFFLFGDFYSYIFHYKFSDQGRFQGFKLLQVKSRFFFNKKNQNR